MAQLYLAFGQDVEAIAFVALAEERVSTLEARFAHELAQCFKILWFEILEEWNALKNARIHVFPF